MDASYKRIGKFYYNPKKVIEQGPYGTIYQAYDQTDKEAKLEVKVIPMNLIQENDFLLDMVQREIKILRQIKGENIIGFVDVMQTAHNLYIVTESCDGGSLETKLNNEGALSETLACSIVKQIAKAFLDLESQEIRDLDGNKVFLMHRNISPANIMFHQGKVKLGDFGFSKVINELEKSRLLSHSSIGSPLYSPPQILNCGKYSLKCDIWSTGIVFYLMLFGVRPWDANSETELRRAMENKPLEFPKSIGNETKDLIIGMLKYNEKERLSWKEVFDHKALKEYKL